MDRERLMRSFERQDSINKAKETLVRLINYLNKIKNFKAKKYRKHNENWLDKSFEMKEYKNNSIVSTRNSNTESLSRKENRIISIRQNKNNVNNRSFSRMSDSDKQKFSNVKISMEKQFEVIIVKFRNKGS